MTVKIKAVSVKEKSIGLLVVTPTGEEWNNLSEVLFNALEDKQKFKSIIWGAEVNITTTGKIITALEIVKQAKPTPATPSQEKDDYWTKKFNYEKDVRDAHLKIKGETDQAISAVKIAFENKISTDAVVKCIKEARKLLFGDKNE